MLGKFIAIGILLLIGFIVWRALKTCTQGKKGLLGGVCAIIGLGGNT